MDTEAEAMLEHVLVFWGAGEEPAEELIEAAALALADGAADEWVLAVASLSPEATSLDIEDVLAAHRRDLPVPAIPRGSQAILMVAATRMARHCLAGTMPPRALTSWAHQWIRHGRSDVLEPLVGLDDDYEMADALGDDAEPHVDQQVLAFAQGLVDGRPVPITRLFTSG